MKGIILAGGTGSRLLPLTKVTNKHLLPVYNKPMIYYPIEFLRESGITDLMIILGGNSVGDFVNLLGDGAQLGVSITYRYQYKADGIAGALKLAADFCGNEPFAVCLGDNIFESPMPSIGLMSNISSDRPTASIFLSLTDKPSSFGVPTFDENKKILKITEKPLKPDSNFAVTGLYIYDKHIWTMIDSLKPSDRGELEITSVNNFYINNGCLNYHHVPGWWRDGGDIEALFEASILASGIKEYLSGIYQIRNTINNKVYIGSSRSLPSRRASHFRTLSANKHANCHLQNAWNKDGKENFSFEILELVKNKNLLDAEKKWFEKTKCCDRLYGYNLAIDPTNNKPSQETRDKISVLKTGIGNAFYGKTHSPEERKRISERNSGTKNGNAKLSDLDISDICVLLKEKLSQSKIAAKFGVHIRTIEHLVARLKKEARENATKK